MPRLSRTAAQLLVIDLQEKLLPRIDGQQAVVDRSIQMIRAAREIGLPITVSEQYPKGIGPTPGAVLDAAGDAHRIEKTAFSLCRDSPAAAHLRGLDRPQVLLVGIETHVCVQQTALDLLEAGMIPFVLADAAGSRDPYDKQMALERMRAAGVVTTTVESAIFELLEQSGTELFKRILPLVR